MRSLTPALCALAGLSGLAFSPSALAQESKPDAPTAPLQYNAAFKVTPGEEAAIARIIEDIGDKRIVALGEISHGDGSSFAFKAKLAQRLYRDHGFDVIAMEGGIYDHMEAEDQIAAGVKPSLAFARANFGLWSEADQFAPMLALVDEAAKSDRPLALVGIDPQHTGYYRNENLQRLTDIANRLGEDGDPIRFMIQVWYSLPRAKQGPDAAFNDVLQRLETNLDQALAAITKAGGPSAESDHRLIENHGKFLRQTALYSRFGLDVMGWDEFNVRDEMMGANLNDFATKLFPDRKIIVWGATAHVIRDRRPIDSEMAMVPMGYHIDQGPVSDDYYVLGFSTLGGRNGTYAGKVFDIDPADADGVESHAMAQSGGAQTALVEMPPCGESQAKIRALGYQYYTGDWGCALDSVVVFREMEPTRYPGKPEPEVAQEG